MPQGASRRCGRGRRRGDQGSGTALNRASDPERETGAVEESGPTLPPGRRESRLTRALARGIVALRYPIVIAWVAAAMVVTTQLPSLEEAQVGALGDLVPAGSQAIDAEVTSARAFGFPLISRTLVVQYDAEGLSAGTQARTAARAVDVTRGDFPGLERVAAAIPLTNALGKPPFSRERSTTGLTYLFFRPEVGQGERIALAERLAGEIERPRDGVIAVTGTLPAREQLGDAILAALPFVTLFTVAVVLGAVALHFRGLGAPLVNLAAIAVAYLVAIRLIAWIGERIGVSVPREVEPVVIALLFGVVTDYSIFFISRFRALLADGVDRREAAVRATAGLLPIIVTAGLTVATASATLFLAELGFFRAFGPGMAMSVLLALLVAVTLVPALLAIVGGALFWPNPPEPAGEGQAASTPRPRRARWVLRSAARRRRRRARPARSLAVTLASRFPRAVTLLCVSLLVTAATGLLNLELGNPLIRGLPPSAEAHEGYVAASKGFTPGILAPTVVVVQGPGIARERRALARLERRLERLPGTAQVLGPSDQPLAQPLGATLAENGDAARLAIVFDSDPLGGLAVNQLRRLEAAMPRLLRDSGLASARASFAGDTALVAETAADTLDDLTRVAPAALLVILLILVAFLRALVAPLYLLASSTLAVLASLGITTYFFQDILGQVDVTYYVPFAAAVLLLALGSDYNVFLVGRVWQEARDRPLREALEVAGARSAKPIAVAGVVLALSFAALALVPVRPFRELAFTMAVGLLLDAFLVRTLLVPALIRLVGERSGWPGRALAPARQRAAPATRT